jgi:hypothetical protein
MKLMNILKEIKITGKKPNAFLKVFLDIVGKKYPNSIWNVQSVDTIQSVETEGTEEATLIAWSIKVPAADSEDSKKLYYVGPTIQDAFTKEYKGVLGEAIKIHIDNLLRQHTDAMPALFIQGENWDPDTWEHIARKYNLELIGDDNWEDYVEVAEDEDDDEQVDALLQILP